jgi:Fic family protein
MARIPLYNPGTDVAYSIIGEIDSKIKTIRNHPEYSQRLRRNIENSLIADANSNSFAMEIPNLDNEGFEEENFHDLTNAWYWGVQNYKGQFSHEFLIELAGKIEPGLNYKKTMLTEGITYRKDNIIVTGKSAVMPVKGTKIEEEMESLMNFLNEKTSPLEKAIFGHLHLARIHPFFDGNGRTSRMIQNLTLNYCGYSVIKIEYGERTFYQRLLRGALRDFNDRETEQNYKGGNIKTFFEYLATIENKTLDNLERELKKSRYYRISFDGIKEKSQLFTIKHTLISNVKSMLPNLGVNVTLDQIKKIIKVKGDISKEQLECGLKSVNNEIKCKVTPLTG